jgi:hypothetical protein
MYFKSILTLSMCLIFQLVYANYQSCLKWTEWLDFKYKFNIQFYNSSFELIAYKLFLNYFYNKLIFIFLI